MQLVVSVADLGISNNKKDDIITHALTSCIGLTIYDPINYIGGMLHFMLPYFTEGNDQNLFMYADTGITLFFKRFEELGGKLKQSEIKACGGAELDNQNDFFNIAKKNITAIQKILLTYKLSIHNADFGGNYYRTMKLSISNGLVLCNNHIYGEWAI